MSHVDASEEEYDNDSNGGNNNNNNNNHNTVSLRTCSELKSKRLVTKELPFEVVISVPHGVCGSFPRFDDDTTVGLHPCDSVAFSRADSLREHLLRCASSGTEKNPGVTFPINVKVHKNTNIPRICMDMNRYDSKDTLFRKKLFNMMETCDMLIDVHSYPAVETSFFDAREYDVVFLVLKPIRCWIVRLFRYLTEKGVKVRIMIASEDNDIIKTAESQGKTNILIEFNETTPSTERVNAVTKHIAEFILNTFVIS